MYQIFTLYGNLKHLKKALKNGYKIQINFKTQVATKWTCEAVLNTQQLLQFSRTVKKTDKVKKTDEMFKVVVLDVCYIEFHENVDVKRGWFPLVIWFSNMKRESPQTDSLRVSPN